MNAAATSTALFAGIGTEFTQYVLDVDQAALHVIGSVTLPAGVQYAWPHPNGRLLYVACSDGGPGRVGTAHYLCVYEMSPAADLRLLGAPLALPHRPVHLTLDRQAQYALVTSANPSGVVAVRLRDDGTLGELVPQRAHLELEKMAHQLLVAPSGHMALLPCRGNPPEEGRPEDPGSLWILDYADGQLTPRTVIAPNGGMGFGPRHVDFHPREPWCYMSIERQDEIALFRLDGDEVSGPFFRKTTLAHPESVKTRQLAGAIHIHPNGRFAYVSNRADGTVPWKGDQVFNDGENSIAVFALDQTTGEPTRIQLVDSAGIHPRTFALDPMGRVLVAANMTTRLVRDGDGVRHVPGCLAVFRVDEQGMLHFVRKYEVDVAQHTMFWAGVVSVRR